MRSVASFVSLSACLLASSVTAANTPLTVNGKKFYPQDIITRDVVVVGGGSSGCHIAVRLQDAGKSVIVVEKSPRLGGHVATYTDPATRKTAEQGLVTFHNTSYVTDYLTRLDIPLAPISFSSTTNLDYDLRTGKPVNRTYNPTQEEFAAGFAGYSAQLAKYPQLNDGTYLPYPVPEDLTMPFGKFLEKYNLTGALMQMYNFNWGTGDFLSNPTVEQMRYWGANTVAAVTTGSFLVTARHNSSEIYTKVGAVLGATSSVLLNSEVTYTRRSEGKAGVQLIVKTPQGSKLLIAKKLVIAIPPKLDFVAPLDLSSTEKDLFGKYIDAGYYVGVVRNTGIPPKTVITNAAQDKAYNLPVLPAVNLMNPTAIDGVWTIFSSTLQSKASFPWADNAVKADIVRSIKALQTSNPDKFQQTEPEIIEWHSHAPYFLQVSAEEIKNGFYAKLYSLQGLRNTHFTGAAWRVHDSSQIWKYTDTQVLPKLLAGL
ncbi:hypothetical protein COCMIDRAFT_104202 [Bipolaris oryzae ATCC 44560]|uniref:Amine oxidase domain-containing protein n=1 Tax=Bipolaris oryzae ATCC 44560 TaxID=930090 RepID=W6ZFF2_COCMI|nr:uncharacterized protein COCMIDRAFT_104202 [Bipolaris oryzae ATCC 44560]EUC42196.1 hypothetical protein COCMIDRAFT_104202 [Bipolaris oryzae ATCC 44560]